MVNDVFGVPSGADGMLGWIGVFPVVRVKCFNGGIELRQEKSVGLSERVPSDSGAFGGVQRSEFAVPWVDLSKGFSSRKERGAIRAEEHERMSVELGLLKVALGPYDGIRKPFSCKRVSALS